MTAKGNSVRTKSRIYYVGLHYMELCPISLPLKFPPSGSREVSSPRVLHTTVKIRIWCRCWCVCFVLFCFLFIHYSPHVKDVWDYTEKETIFFHPRFPPWGMIPAQVVMRNMCISVLWILILNRCQPHALASSGGEKNCVHFLQVLYLRNLSK